MARTSAISLLQGLGDRAELSQIYGIVIDNVQKDTLSNALKSQAYTGNPATGSVEFKRFTNSGSKAYGTARAAGKGDAITAPPVVVNLNIHREIVEECSKFDLDTFGVGSIMRRRAANHIDSMASELDTAFFFEAYEKATILALSATEEAAQLEEVIVDLETTKDEHSRGVPRSMISAVLSPAFYSAIRLKLDSLPKANVDTAAEDFGTFHGVKVYSSINLPTGVKMIVMARASVAQPVVTYPYGEPEKIPFSNDYASALFWDYGVKALTPNLIRAVGSAPAALAELDATSVAGTVAIGDTVITVAPAPAEGNKLVYKLGTSYISFGYNATLSTGWTEFESGDTIAAASSTKITVAEVTANNLARGRGIAALSKKTA